MLQRLAGMDKLVDNSCKQRAGCFFRSLVIVYMERGQWQATLTQEKLTRPAEVCVTQQILQLLSFTTAVYGHFFKLQSPENLDTHK